eukprot:5219959-Amphidinium_carterae.1
MEVFIGRSEINAGVNARNIWSMMETGRYYNASELKKELEMLSMKVTKHNVREVFSYKYNMLERVQEMELYLFLLGSYSYKQRFFMCMRPVMQEITALKLIILEGKLLCSGLEDSTIDELIALAKDTSEKKSVLVRMSSKADDLMTNKMLSDTMEEKMKKLEKIFMEFEKRESTGMTEMQAWNFVLHMRHDMLAIALIEKIFGRKIVATDVSLSATGYLGIFREKTPDFLNINRKKMELDIYEFGVTDRLGPAMLEEKVKEYEKVILDISRFLVNWDIKMTIMVNNMNTMMVSRAEIIASKHEAGFSNRLRVERSESSSTSVSLKWTEWAKEVSKKPTYLALK